MLNGLGKKLLLIAAACLLATPLCASTASRIDSVINRSDQKKVQFAVKVIDASSGKTIYSRNSTKTMIPASNAKIVASAAALKYLGPGYKFTTTVGMLGNTLVIIGAGDPLLGDPETDAKHGRKPGWLFADIIKALKDARIRSIDGIIADTTFFDNNRVHPSWPADQLNRYYACEVSGLNYNANCVKIDAKRKGKSVALTLTPSTAFVTLVNKVKASSKTNAVGAWRNSVPNKLIVKGYCKTESGFDAAIEKPAAFFAFLLAERLAAAGIEVKGDFTEKYIKKDSSIRTLRTYKTPIAEVLTRCNADSFGLAAESLIKTISAENTTYRINGEWPHGLNLAKRYLLSTGVKAAEFTLIDGSGLSRQNKLSPNALTSILRDIYKGPNRKFFEETLAVGGLKGSRPVRAYFTEKKYKGKVFAKSGTLDGVKALSGICRTDHGDRIFSIITNKANANTRKAINDIVKAIFE